MKNKSLAVITGLVALLAVALLPASGVMAAGKQYVEAGLNYFYFDYKEDLVPPLKSAEYGWGPGFTFAYGYQGTDNPIYGRFSIEVATFKTTYDGSTQAGVPLKDKTDSTFNQFEGVLGYTFYRVDSGLTLTGYTGLGYRNWQRNLGVNSSGGYNEDYTWMYIPVGLITEFPVGDIVTVGLDVSARFMINGQMHLSTITYTDIDGVLHEGHTFTLGNKIGWKIMVPINVQLSEHFSLMLRPWYEHSGIGKSDTVTDYENGVSYWEPASRTHQYGSTAGLRFWF